MGSYTPKPKLHDQTIHTISIPELLRKSGQVTSELIAEGAAFLHKDGIIILENAIDVSHIDALNNKLQPEALEIARDPNHHWNFGTPNMDQAPPPTKEYMYKDVWCNPFAAAILSAVMGPRPVIHYANGNTALKADPKTRQPVHSDCEFAHPVYFPWAYVMNIYLCDASPENGSTEFWPGSHHVSVPSAHVSVDSTDDLLAIDGKNVETRRKHSPAIQARAKRGSMIIRDLRLWHAGMPNLTDTPRIMLAFVAQPAWFKGRSKVQLPLNVKEMVESWSDEMQIAAEWVDGKVDYKKLNSSTVDFDTGSEALQKYRDELSRWPEYVPRWY